jgi:hypothetical protein
MSRVPTNFLYYHQTESILRQFIAPLFSDTRLKRFLTFKLINITSILNYLDFPKQFVQVRGSVWHFETWGHSPKPQPRNTTPCRLPAITYSIYSQLPSISDELSPTYATRGRAIHGYRRLLNMHQYLWRIFIAPRHEHYVWRLCVIIQQNGRLLNTWKTCAIVVWTLDVHVWHEHRSW